jgi:hypothetical protein
MKGDVMLRPSWLQPALDAVERADIGAGGRTLPRRVAAVVCGQRAPPGRSPA